MAITKNNLVKELRARFGPKPEKFKVEVRDTKGVAKKLEPEIDAILVRKMRDLNHFGFIEIGINEFSDELGKLLYYVDPEVLVRELQKIYPGFKINAFRIVENLQLPVNIFFS